jgi:hypothetical protein
MPPVSKIRVAYFPIPTHPMSSQSPIIPIALRSPALRTHRCAVIARFCGSRILSITRWLELNIFCFYFFLCGVFLYILRYCCETYRFFQVPLAVSTLTNLEPTCFTDSNRATDTVACFLMLLTVDMKGCHQNINPDSACQSSPLPCVLHRLTKYLPFLF